MLQCLVEQQKQIGECPPLKGKNSCRGNVRYSGIEIGSSGNVSIPPLLPEQYRQKSYQAQKTY